MIEIGSRKRAKLTGLALALVLGLPGCSDGGSTDQEATPPETGAEAAAGPTATEIIQAIQDAGVPATNARDNTQGCTFGEQPEDSCTSLVTTDQVSVYAWPTADQAMRFTPLSDCSGPDMPSTGGVRCGVSVGHYTILVGNDSDFPVPDAGPYVEAATEAIGG